MHRPDRRQASRGQAIVIFAGGLIAIVLGVGLVIDVGFAWAQQRNAQNGADASARAGAIVLAQHQADGPASTKTGFDVWNAVQGTATTNEVTVEPTDAHYTDWQGNPLAGDPAVVAGGSIPAGAAGVRVTATRIQGTFLIRVIGQTEWRVRQDATAVSGPTTGCADTLQGCVLLPITFPVTVFACTNTGKTQPVDPPQEWTTGQKIILPICGGNPGSVGWLDWTPPAGGSSELANVIVNPPPVSVPLPSWQYITQTGDISAKTVEDAINTYAGQVVLLPFFDSTCNTEPTNTLLSGCPIANVGGAGTNQWYHITKFLAFELDDPKGAFVNGNNSAECQTANAMECLKGAFITFITEGPVGPSCPPAGCPVGTAFSVQLIK
ncbi:MAG TPA: pilus assembly protein TadG-related protein [Candidatus Limnocylindrales bacterium]|nr:pilus assembly protein TadG-related protein [Candidatus Limnocylindrales bacterium]